MRKATVSLLAICVLSVLAAEAVYACTARNTIDKAKRTRDTDLYNAATDVAEEMIDEEKWERDVTTIEAGAGTLLYVRNGLRSKPETADEFRAALDGPNPARTSSESHGITLSGISKGRSATLREHMRFHIKEWDDALKGNRDDLVNWWTEKGYAGSKLTGDTTPSDVKRDGGSPPADPTNPDDPSAPVTPAQGAPAADPSNDHAG